MDLLRRSVVLTLVMASLVLVPSALAGDRTVLSGYGGSASNPVVQVAGQSTQPPASSSGSLPFTGAELMWFLVGGSVLVAIGVGLWRLGRDAR